MKNFRCESMSYSGGAVREGDRAVDERASRLPRNGAEVEKESGKPGH